MAAPSARVTVPVDLDRSHATTVPLAAAIARQAGTEVEFVCMAGAVADRSVEHRLQACCSWALAEGAPGASWSVLTAGDEQVGAYATWSGAGLLCLSTGRHQHGLGAIGWALIRQSGVPLLMCGPRTRPSSVRYRRLVVGVNGGHPQFELVSAAAVVSRRLDMEVVFTQVVPPSDAGRAGRLPSLPYGDVQESAYLHRLVEAAGCPGSSYDTLHAMRAADGILRFVDQDPATLTMVGAPATTAHHHLRAAAPVARGVLRRSLSPVLLVPTRARPLR